MSGETEGSSLVPARDSAIRGGVVIEDVLRSDEPGAHLLLPILVSSAI